MLNGAALESVEGVPRATPWRGRPLLAATLPLLTATRPYHTSGCATGASGAQMEGLNRHIVAGTDSFSNSTSGGCACRSRCIGGICASDTERMTDTRGRSPAPVGLAALGTWGCAPSMADSTASPRVPADAARLNVFAATPGATGAPSAAIAPLSNAALAA